MATTRILALLSGGLFLTYPVAAQAPTPPARTAVFLDCEDDCDFDFYRREVAFVDWARDRADADVHLLVTSQETGGGDDYTLTFIGLRRFNGMTDTLHLITRNTDVDDEVRAAQVKVIKLGLVRFVAGTPIARELTISYASPLTPAAAQVTRDPWNYWTFNTSLNGSVSGEERSRSRSLRVGASASRVTDARKIETSISISRSHEEVETDDTTTFVNASRDYEGELLAVQSLGAHWSAGWVTNARTTTFQNLDLQLEAGPGIEFDIFPYSQTSRKRFSFRYTIGGRYNNYEEPTFFDRVSETHPVHDFQIQASLTQPWGSIYAEAEAFQYLHDLSKHNLSLFTNVSIRIVRGLSFDANAEVERIKDQIFLPRGEASPEEIVAERRQLGTGYSFDLNFGFSYRFGSKFNNVVNPRFGGD